MSDIFRYKTCAGASGKRLDRFLVPLCPSLSRSQLESLIEKGEVLVEGERSKKSRKLKGGETIELRMPPPISQTPSAQNLPITILYEDQDLIVLDKAPGMVVHPAAGNLDQTLVNALLFHIGAFSPKGVLPGIVHRLDRDTSGCLVVAKHDKALLALQHEFQAHRVEKRYIALCHGVPKEKNFSLDTLYGRHPVVRTRFTTKNPTGKTRRAISHVTILEEFSNASLLEIRIETGRTHQIRVHLLESGHPVFHDSEYGGVKRESRLEENDPRRLAANAIGRQALHARFLSFLHPGTQKVMQFQAPCPKTFQEALRILKTVP